MYSMTHYENVIQTFVCSPDEKVISRFTRCVSPSDDDFCETSRIENGNTLVHAYCSSVLLFGLNGPFSHCKYWLYINVFAVMAVHLSWMRSTKSSNRTVNYWELSNAIRLPTAACHSLSQPGTKPPCEHGWKRINESQVGKLYYCILSFTLTESCLHVQYVGSDSWIITLLMFISVSSRCTTVSSNVSTACCDTIGNKKNKKPAIIHGLHVMDAVIWCFRNWLQRQNYHWAFHIIRLCVRVVREKPSKTQQASTMVAGQKLSSKVPGLHSVYSGVNSRTSSTYNSNNHWRSQSRWICVQPPSSESRHRGKITGVDNWQVQLMLRVQGLWIPNHLVCNH